MPVEIEVTALVVRHGTTVVSVTLIDGEEADACAVYAKHKMPDFAEFCAKVANLYFGSPEYLGRAIQAYRAENDTITLSGYAGQLPSIGSVRVSVETRKFIWP